MKIEKIEQYHSGDNKEISIIYDGVKISFDYDDVDHAHVDDVIDLVIKLLTHYDYIHNHLNS